MACAHGLGKEVGEETVHQIELSFAKKCAAIAMKIGRISTGSCGQLCDFSQRLAVLANFCLLGQRPGCGAGCFRVSYGIVMGLALRSPMRWAPTSDVTLALV